MSVEVSSLRVEVVSAGVKDAANDLMSLGNAARVASGAVDGLGNKSKKVDEGISTAGAKATSATAKIVKLSDSLANLMSQTNSATEKAMKHVEALERIRSMSLEAADSTRALNANFKAFRDVADSLDSIGRNLKSVSGQAKAAGQNLASFASRASTAASKTKLLTDNLAALIPVIGTAEMKLASLVTGFDLLTQHSGTAAANTRTVRTEIAAVQGALSGSATSAQQLATAMGQAGQGIQQTSQAARQAQQAHQGHNDVLRVITNTIKAMTTAWLVYSTVGIAKATIDLSDSWVMLNSRLQVATGSTEGAVSAQREMFTLAQQMRVPLNEVVGLYTKMVVPMTKLGYTSEDSKRMVEGLSIAMQLNGSTAGEASSAMLQFSQTVNEGKLNGGEFNAMAERAPQILRAIEDELRRTGKWTDETGKSLKKMGADGEIGLELINAAIKNAVPEWRREFEQLPMSVDSAMTLVVNSFTKLVGQSPAVRSFTTALAKDFKDLAGFMDELGGAVDRLDKKIGDKKHEDSMHWYTELFAKFTQNLLANSKQLMVVMDVVQAFADAVDAADKQGKSPGEGWINGIKAGFKAYSALRVERAEILGTVDALKAYAGAKADVDRENSRLLKLAPAPTPATDPFFNAPKLEEVRKFVKTRESILQQNYDEQVKMAQAYGAAIQKAEQSGNSDSAMRLRSELNANLIQMQKDVQVDLKNLANKGVDHSIEKYEKLIANAQSMRDIAKEQLNDTEKMTQAEKELIKLRDGTGDYHNAPTDVRAKAQALLQQAQAYQEQYAAAKKVMELDKQQKDKMVNKTSSVNDEVAALREKISLYGKAEEGAAEAISKVKEIDQQLKENVFTSDQLVILQNMRQAWVDLAAAKTEYGNLLAEDKLDKLLNPDKVQRFGDALKDAFGDAGKGLGKLLDGFKRYEVSMKRVADLREVANSTTDLYVWQKATEAATKEETNARIRGYADAASAAAQFFGQHTALGKAAHIAEIGFRSAEIALKIKNAAVELGLINETTIAKVVGWVKEEAAATAAAPGIIASNMAIGQSAAVAGTANQANGDPYSAFFRMAAMAAIMTALGFAVAGHHGSKVDKGNMGTGTVFGDIKNSDGEYTKQSESIANSLDALNNVDTMTMRYSAQMAASLKTIEASISGIANLTVRSGAQTKFDFINNKQLTSLGKAFSFMSSLESGFGTLGPIDGILQKTVAKLFSAKTTVNAQGVYGSSQSLGSILSNGFNAQYYADVNTKKKAFGISYSSKNSTQFSDEGTAELDSQFTKLITSFADAVTLAGDALGTPFSEIENRLNGFVVSIGKINLQGLSGEEVQEKLNAVFGAMADGIAQTVLPGFIDFQKVGEGYFETVVRIGSAVEEATVSLRMMGVATSDIVSLSQVVNKQSDDLASEIARQTLSNMETVGGALTGVGEIIQNLSGDTSTLIDTYKQLTAVRSAMEDAGLGSGLSRDIIIAAGGLDALNDAVKSYYDSYFTDAEKQATATSRMQQQFAKLNLAMPASTAAFRTLVEQLNGSGQQDLATKVILLSESFADLFTSTDDAIGDAKDALRDAYERESDALKDVIDRFGEFSDSLKEFKSSLITGDLSPLTATEKYYQQYADYTALFTKAMSGDEDAISKFENVAQEFLKTSQTYNASGSNYTADFNNVLANTQALEAFTADKKSVAEQQLEALDKQVGVLIDIKEATLTVAEAINKLLVAQGIPAVDGSHANGLSYVPFDGYVAELHQGERVLTAAENRSYQMDYSRYGANSGNAALIEEIKSLRSELTQLRQEQQQQTNALIGANYDAQQRNAESVVEGVKDAASSTTYSERARTKLA